jgi:hypothetical protein
MISLRRAISPETIPFASLAFFYLLPQTARTVPSFEDVPCRSSPGSSPAPSRRILPLPFPPSTPLRGRHGLAYRTVCGCSRRASCVAHGARLATRGGPVRRSPLPGAAPCCPGARLAWPAALARGVRIRGGSVPGSAPGAAPTAWVRRAWRSTVGPRCGPRWLRAACSTQPAHDATPSLLAARGRSSAGARPAQPSPRLPVARRSARGPWRGPPCARCPRRGSLCSLAAMPRVLGSVPWRGCGVVPGAALARGSAPGAFLARG